MLLKLLVFLFVAVVGLALGKQGPETICPPAYLLTPYCSCSKECEMCPAMIECPEILNFHDLVETVFKNTEDYTFWDFSIVNSTFTHLPANAIVEKRVRKLRLINTILSQMFDAPPASTNLLQELELTNTRILGGVRWERFSNMVHLKEFNVTNVVIKKIDQSFVLNFPQGVEGLYLRQTKTKLLADDAFVNLANLTRILIRDTEISELKRSMFPPVSKLMAMHFSGNQISSLPDDLFNNMPDLVVVDFSNTKVVTLPESVFGRIMPQLGVLYLEGNAVNCNCQMKWIQELQMVPYGVKCTKPRQLEGHTLKMFKEDHFLHCE